MLKIINKLSFGNQCLLALFFGAIYGYFAPPHLVSILLPLSDAFLQLLKMIVIPLTFVMIVTSFTKIDNLTHLKELGFKTLFWFLITALFGATIGLLTALWIKPGINLENTLPILSLRQKPPLSQIFLDMLPGNLIDQIAHGKIIPIIIFALLFAIALTIYNANNKERTVTHFFNESSFILSSIMRWIIRLAPIGIFVSIAEVVSHYGLNSLIPFGKFIVTVYLACIAQLIIYSLLLSFVAKMNPLKFFSLSMPMLLTAFSTSSSLATLPVTIETLIKKIKIPESIASFVASLGANAKMDGCGAIFPAIVCIFTANCFQISLDWYQYLIIIITAAIATIGTAGVPGSAIVMTMVVLSSLGLPFTALAMVIGIDKINDMIRTTVNVTGAAVCAVLIANTLKPKMFPEKDLVYTPENMT